MKKEIRSTTLDRGPPGAPVTIHTVEQLGPNMSLLPNGNLLCANVPIARVGWMMYGPGETPIKVGDQGVAYVERTAATLFDPVCIGSFMGAAVVDEHPEDDVTPNNWKQLSKGFATTNVRQGSGDDIDVLLADLIIADKMLIRSIQDGKREVSCGYDADYNQTADGVGTQTNIIGNHIALVEKGRCGPRCAIGDQAFQPQPKKEKPMATQRVKLNSPKRRAVLDGLRQKVLDAEEELQSAELTPPDTGELGDGSEAGGDTHIHIHTGSAKAPETEDDGEGEAPAGDGNEQRFAAIEATLQSLSDAIAKLSAPAESTGDDSQQEDGPGEDPGESDGGEDTQDGAEDLEEAKKEDKQAATKDSVALETSYANVLAQAEVLVPGFRMPTFDAKAKRKATIDQMCSARRKALDACSATASGQELIRTVSGKHTLDLASMACPAVATLFRAAAGAKALLNNAAATKDSGSAQQVAAISTTGTSIAAINEANRKYWEGKKAK